MFFRKFGYAFRGIGKALREETSLHVMLGCFALAVARVFCCA
jgi:diacylglycerol kinase